MTEDLQKSLQLINSTFEMLQDKDLVDLDLREELL